MTKPKLIITKGLPGSGKSHWAKQQVRDGGKGEVIRVNKDDLRAMLHCSEWSPGNEKFVLMVRDFLVVTGLSGDKTVIVDDTNLQGTHEQDLRGLAEKFDADFEIKDFTDVPVEICLARDQARGAASVGAKVIKGMVKYLPDKVKALPSRIEPNPQLPSCIICDIDGTIAHMGDRRSPFDWMKVGVDAPDLHVKAVLSRLISNEEEPPKLFYFSGRDAVCRQESLKWLDGHHFPKDPQTSGDGSTLDYTLVMRPEGDCRSDAIVKMEFYEEHIKGQYNVLCVLDDRDRVVQMWRELGLLVLQVAPGNF